MKDILKNGGILWLKTVVATIMSFFIVISILFLCTAFFTEETYYIAKGAKEGDEQVEILYEHYFKDGEDTKKAEYEAQGYTVVTENMRSELAGKGKVIYLVISQLFSLAILISFIYPKIWDMGAKDSNLIRFKHKEEDKLRGFKIGLVAVAPNYLYLIFIVIAKLGLKPDLQMALYKFLNASFYSVIDLAVGGANTVAELSVIRLMVLFILPLVVPLVAGGAYLLGLNNYSISEKLIYKKNNNKEKF